MINSKFLRNNRGFTLLEVLLSLTILGIILTSTMSFFSQAYSYTKINENKTVGINVARNALYYMEQLEFKGVLTYIENYKTAYPSEEWIPITCSSSIIENEVVCNNILNPQINNIDFTATVNVALHSNLQDYLIPVKVRVEWGQEKSAEVEGVIKD